MINWDKFVERKTEMLPSTFKSIAELAEQCIEDPDESIEFDGKLGKKYKRLFKGYRWGDYDV
jgi:hypothetical protein